MKACAYDSDENFAFMHHFIIQSENSDYRLEFGPSVCVDTKSRVIGFQLVATLKFAYRMEVKFYPLKLHGSYVIFNYLL